MLLSSGYADKLYSQPPSVDATSGAVDRAVGEFVARLTPQEHQEFQNVRRKEGLALFHFGSGSRFRAKYFATPPVSAMRRAYCGTDPSEYCDIDAASMDMVVKAWELIRAESQR